MVPGSRTYVLHQWLQSGVFHIDQVDTVSVSRDNKGERNCIEASHGDDRAAHLVLDLRVINHDQSRLVVRICFFCLFIFGLSRLLGQVHLSKRDAACLSLLAEILIRDRLSKHLVSQQEARLVQA